jgi:hypothetical protein
VKRTSKLHIDNASVIDLLACGAETESFVPSFTLNYKNNIRIKISVWSPKNKCELFYTTTREAVASASAVCNGSTLAQYGKQAFFCFCCCRKADLEQPKPTLWCTRWIKSESWDSRPSLARSTFYFRAQQQLARISHSKLRYCVQRKCFILFSSDT